MDQVYKGPFLVFSDVKLGFSLTNKDVVHAGLRRQPNGYDEERPDYSQHISNKGYEATIGYERNIPLVWKLCLLPELGFFYDKATMTGTIYRDMKTPININRKRTYTGAYLELKAGVKISAHIYLLAGSKIRAGHVGITPPQQRSGTDSPQEGNTVAYEPLSTLGFRYQL